MSIPTETRREAYEESRKEAPTRCKEIYRRLCEGGPIWLFAPAFASVLLGWAIGRREGLVE